MTTKKKEVREVKYIGFDSHRRPVFQEQSAYHPAYFYGCTDKLVPTGDAFFQREWIKKNIKARHLECFGWAFDCEPRGGAPRAALKIVDEFTEKPDMPLKEKLSTRKYLPHLPTLPPDITSEEARSMAWINKCSYPKAERQKFNQPMSGSSDFWCDLAAEVMRMNTSQITFDQRMAVKYTVFNLLYGSNKKDLKNRIRAFVKEVNKDES